MTAAADLIHRLASLGFELIPDPPDIRVEYRHGTEPPPETPALLDELRVHKQAALELLAEGLEWNESGERARLDRAYDEADEIACGVPSWADAWTWCRAERPDLADAVDAALDAIDASFKAEDASAHASACHKLVAAVEAVAAEYRSASEPRRRCPA